MHPCIKLLIQSCLCLVRARAHLSNRCIIQIASGRSKLAGWGYIAIGSWFITKTEVDQADHSIHSFKSSRSPKIAVAWFDKIFSLGKIFKRQFDRIINGQESDNRLMLLQDVSSFALFPSYLIMLSSHVVYEAFCSDDFWKPLVYAEYISSIVLTGLLLLRLMIYMLGIEKAAENLLLLYESRKDFMVVIVFSLLPHFSVSLALALKDRYRRETAEENFHNRTDNSSFAVNQQTTHGSKQQATNEFASRISGFLEAILDPTFERAGVLESPEEMNWEDVVLAVVRVIGMMIVPFALHNIILATMMSKRGEQYQAHASGMWKLARAMIIMSIDEEIVTHKHVKEAVSRKDDDVYFQQGPGCNDDDNDNDDAWLVDLTLRYKVGSDSYMEYMGIPTQVNEYLCACLCALVSLRQLARTLSTIVIVYFVYTSSTHQPHAYAQTQTRRWICRPI